MTEELRELTEKHDHALERINAYETAQRGHRRWLITAILTALGTAGGGGGFAYMDGAGDDKFETVVAIEAARSSQFREDTRSDLARLADEQIKIGKALARLQATVEILSQRSARARRELGAADDLIESIGNSPPPKRKAKGRPGKDAIQHFKAQLFQE
jgi:hypothetical protein